jgi:hypothetical protein
MKKPFKHFDMPTQHLAGYDTHFIPPKARSAAETERRRSRPAGALVAEHQLHGIQIAATVLARVSEQPDIDFVSQLIGVSGLNTASYVFPKGDVMRRRILLPNMIGEDGVEPPRTADHLEAARHGLREATVAAEGLLIVAGEKSKATMRLRMELGRQIGETSLGLICADMADIVPFDNELAIQSMARQQSLLALEASRTMGAEIGTPPSLAQLADPDSHLSVYFRREAPNGAYQAFEEATSLYAIAA